ncbi:MAG: hypothetical protein ONB05_10860 [candidate division KSB1 bacterium]|nr:hypothetical protein [candidate division KSB1 bacterium]
MWHNLDRDGKNIYSPEYISEYDLGEITVVQEAAKELLRKDLIEKENNTHRISDVFFEQWLKKYIL